MSFRTLVHTSSTQQVLYSGDTFILQTPANLGVLDTAITTTGSTDTTIMGAVVSADGHAFETTDGLVTELVIAQTGTAIAQDQSAVEILSNSWIDVFNAGTVIANANHGFDLRGVSAGFTVDIEMVNSGTILAGASGVRAESDNADLVFLNSGLIEARGTGADLSSDGEDMLFFDNSGTIKGVPHGVVFLAEQARCGRSTPALSRPPNPTPCCSHSGNSSIPEPW